MGGEDGQAGVVETGQRHQRVAVRALVADLLRVGAGGLVAMVAVGDQQLGVGQLLRDRGVDLGVGDAPDAVDGAVVVVTSPQGASAIAGSTSGQASALVSEKIGERLWRVARVRSRRSCFGPGWVRSWGRTRPGP